MKNKVFTFATSKPYKQTDNESIRSKNAPTLKTLNKNNVWDLQENDIFRLLDGIDRDSDQKDNLRHYTDIMRGAFSIEEITDEATTIKAKYENKVKVGQIRLDEDTKITWAVKSAPYNA